jgi:hypothetical protein
VDDLFMSLIHACELNAANPFDYLTQLLLHAKELQRSPSDSSSRTAGIACVSAGGLEE